MLPAGRSQTLWSLNGHSSKSSQMARSRSSLVPSSCAWMNLPDLNPSNQKVRSSYQVWFKQSSTVRCLIAWIILTWKHIKTKTTRTFVEAVLKRKNVGTSENRAPAFHLRKIYRQIGAVSFLIGKSHREWLILQASEMLYWIRFLEPLHNPALSTTARPSILLERRTG